MNLLQDLLGGGDQANGARDFLNRYEQDGNPTTGYSLQEALQHYHRLAPKLSPEQYQQAAEQSFANMSPDLRDQFGQVLQQQAQQHGVNLPNLLGAGSQQFQNPNYLAQVTSQLHQNGLLNTILGGALGGASSAGLGNIVGGLTGGNQGFSGSGIEGTAGGFAGNAAENAAGSLGGIFGSPAVKAAIGGIAANAVKGILHSHGI